MAEEVLEQKKEIDGYAFEAEIARGGMSVVYRGIQLSLKRPVAIKFLSNEFSDHDFMRHTFEQESFIVAQLSHPNIVQVIDRGISKKGSPYFVMEYVTGYTLGDYNKKQKPSIERKMQIMMDILKAVDYAHRNGIIHRDLKPSNVIIDQHEVVKLLDFGIATFLHNPTSNKGFVLGTPEYMSPEQTQADSKIDYLTDIYSLGVIMYELFTGNLPSRTKLSAPSKLNPEIPPDISRVILRCLSPNKDIRPQSAIEILDLYRKTLDGQFIDDAEKKQAKDLVGDQRNQFILIDILSNDQNCPVYLFEDKVNKRFITIKKFLKKYVNEATIEMLKNSALDHIACVLGGKQKGACYVLIQPYLAGGNLWDQMITPCQGASFLKLALSMCEAMAEAHACGIYHKNLHPKHILFDSHGHIFIDGFGIDWKAFDKDPTLKRFHASHSWSDLQQDIVGLGKILKVLYWGKSSTTEEKPCGEFTWIIDKMLSPSLGESYRSFESVCEDFRMIKVEELPDLDATQLRVHPEKNASTVRKQTFSLKGLTIVLILSIALTIAQLYLLFPKEVKAVANQIWSTILGLP